MKPNQRMIARMLRNLATNFENDKCGLTDEEMMEVATMLMHRKMNIEQTCQYYGISRATLNRWQQMGKMPPFRKDSGGKDYLFLDECENCLELFSKQSNCLTNNPIN